MHGLQFVLYEGSVIIGAVASVALARRETFAMRHGRVAENGDLVIPTMDEDRIAMTTQTHIEYSQSVLLCRDVSHQSLKSLGKTKPSIILQLWHETSFQKSHG
jgi:hypothetical protein